MKKIVKTDPQSQFYCHSQKFSKIRYVLTYRPNDEGWVIEVLLVYQ